MFDEAGLLPRKLALRHRIDLEPDGGGE